MKKWSFVFVIGFSISTIAVLDAFAGPHTGTQSSISETSPIVELGPTLSPFQHVRFCNRYPADCEPNSRADALVELNSETFELLKRINHHVNAAIASAQKDYDNALDAFWTIGPTSGDCNDYSVTKRHELLQRGLPSSALRLSVVKTAEGEGHLVLVVASTKGDLILDNLTDEIRPWKETEYRWLKIQSRNDPHYWVQVKSPIVVSAALKEVFRKMSIGASR
jgi:predicted transglutaminase-like cysteine proteinase